jgi:hypothetical protein
MFVIRSRTPASNQSRQNRYIRTYVYAWKSSGLRPRLVPCHFNCEWCQRRTKETINQWQKQDQVLDMEKSLIDLSQAFLITSKDGCSLHDCIFIQSGNSCTTYPVKHNFVKWQKWNIENYFKVINFFPRKKMKVYSIKKSISNSCKQASPLFPPKSNTYVSKRVF